MYSIILYILFSFSQWLFVSHCWFKNHVGLVFVHLWRNVLVIIQLRQLYRWTDHWDGTKTDVGKNHKQTNKHWLYFPCLVITIPKLHKKTFFHVTSIHFWTFKVVIRIRQTRTTYHAQWLVWFVNNIKDLFLCVQCAIHCYPPLFLTCFCYSGNHFRSYIVFDTFFVIFFLFSYFLSVWFILQIVTFIYQRIYYMIIIIVMIKLFLFLFSLSLKIVNLD